MNETEFEIGDNVNVESRPDDIFTNDFTGTITDIVRGYIQVVDQEGDVWDCEPEQVTLANED